MGLQRSMLRSALVRAARRVAVQQQRTYADAAVATKANIWDELGDLVTSDEGKRELATLRSTYTDIAQKLAKMAADPEPINWAAWSKEIDPKLVQEFQQAYETMKLPKFEGNHVAEANAQFAALLKEAEALEAASRTRVVEIQKELASLQKEKERIATTTIDDELAADPKLAEEIDSEIQKNYFMVS